MTSTELLLRAQHLREQRTPFVLATVVRAQRPTSAKPGDSALVLPDGTVEGFVGGSCAATTVRVQGLRLISSGESTLLRITPDVLSTDGTEEIVTEAEGLVTVANPCLSGGTLEIFMEAVLPPALVHVFGDAPVAQALVRLGATLGYQITATTDPAAPVPVDAYAVVIAAHGIGEEPVIRAALAADVAYLGMVASRRRAAGVLDEMGLTVAERQRVHSPAGLDIGARGANEIALSIFAEMVAERPATPPAAAASQPRVAIDPVCGMQVAIVAGALRHDHDGETFYFCGSGCREAFATAPERYRG
jgi:xanthine dehydrogenase accessory factor